MDDLQESVTIAAPPGRVWDSVVDYGSRPRWAPRVKRGPDRRRRSPHGVDRFTATVVEFQPPQRLSLLVKGPGFRVNHVYELTPNEEATDVALTGRFRGVIGRLVARFMRRRVQRDLTDELAGRSRPRPRNTRPGDVTRPGGYIRCGVSMLISSRHRARQVLAASASFSLALVIPSSPDTPDTTRHFS